MPTPLSPARPGSAERLSRMVQLPTVAGKGDAPFDSLAQLLAADYPLVHKQLELEAIERYGMLYRWKGASSDRPTVFMAHLDVVPADPAGWEDEPFSGKVHDGIVWGRGTLDDKGPLLIIIEAVENLLADGFTPAQDVYLSFGSNEETYGTDAIAAAQLFHDRGITPWMVIDEGGAVVDAPLSFLPVKSAMIGVGEKGTMVVRLTVRGDGGHASAPSTVTTAGRLARAILRLQRNPFRVSMPKPFRQMVANFEPHVSLRYRLLLWALRTFHAPAARLLVARGGEPAALMRTTVVATMLDGGSAANVLPSSLSAVLNLRIAQGETIESVLATMTKHIADDTVEITLDEGSDPSPLSPADNEQFALITRGVDETYPGTVTAPYVMMAATDSRHFHAFTPNVYRFTPLAMTAAQRAAIHGANEFVTIDSLERGERFFQVVIRGLH